MSRSPVSLLLALVVACTGFACGDSDPAPVQGVGAVPSAPPGVAPPPVAQPPVGQPPVGQPPVGQPPVAQPPVGQPPVGQPPVGQPPVGQPPVGQPPVAGNANADWPMMGYDLASTYRNVGETTLTKENASSLEVAWKKDLGGLVLGGALQVGDKIYASGPARVFAFEAATGTEIWNTSVGSTSTLAYDNGTLYLNDNGSNIVAISAENGDILWSKPSNPDDVADGSSSALVAGDKVFIGGSNGSIELGIGSFRGFMGALDKETGDSAWVSYTVPNDAEGASMWSSPAADLEAGVVYGSTGNNYGRPATDTSDALVAFDMETGNILWKNQLVANDTFGGGSGPDADFGANPVVYETMVGGAMTKVVASGNKGGSAHAVRAEDGTQLWTRDLCPGSVDGSRGIFTNAAWTGTHMLFACNKGSRGTLYALDGATGDIGWERDLPGPVWGRTAVANGVGAVGAGGTLEVFDVDTGSVIKTFQSDGGTIASTITIAHGRIAFGEGLQWSSGVRGRTLTVLSLP